MNVTLEDAYAEACKSLGESIVRERLLTVEVQRLTAENEALKAAQRPPGGSTDPNPHDNVMPC